MPVGETSPPERGEFELIRSVFRPLAAGQPGALNLTDDAACLTSPPGHDIVLTADAIVAGVHFLPEDPAEDVGVKLLGVNLSDLAAMGADPLGYLITTNWSKPIDAEWIEAFAKGLGTSQSEHGIGLLGGDTVSSRGPMTLSLTAVGAVPHGQALKRSGARHGDVIYVSGTIGDAALGLALLKGEIEAAAGRREFLIERYRRPRPRLSLGRALRGLATACIDVSDGLLADLGHILETSSVGADIELTAVPLSAGDAGEIGVADRIDAVTGGDDYELLFTVPPSQAQSVAQAAMASGVPITAIGKITTGTGATLHDANGKVISARRAGFQHF